LNKIKGKQILCKTAYIKNIIKKYILKAYKIYI
jgi:hypothetical protein